MNGKVVGRILEVAHVGEHRKTPDCEVIEIAPFISGIGEFEVTFTRAEIWDDKIIELLRGKRNFSVGAI